MITAHSFTQGNAMLVELSYPNNAPKHYATVKSAGEVERLLYFHTRSYIIDRLHSWLRQRKEALKFSPESAKINQVAQLQVIISYHQQASFQAVCAVVTRHSQQIKLIAPGEHSKAFSYYSSTILPILLYCETIK